MTPLVVVGGELLVGGGEQRLRPSRLLVTLVRGDALDGQQHPGDGGPTGVAQLFEQGQALRGRLRAPRARMDRARAGPFHQRHRLQRAGAGER
jgi:hypothetical protein